VSASSVRLHRVLRPDAGEEGDKAIEVVAIKRARCERLPRRSMGLGIEPFAFQNLGRSSHAQHRSFQRPREIAKIGFAVAPFEPASAREPRT